MAEEANRKNSEWHKDKKRTKESCEKQSNTIKLQFYNYKLSEYIILNTLIILDNPFLINQMQYYV